MNGIEGYKNVFVGCAGEDLARALEVREFLVQQGLNVFVSDPAAAQQGGSYLPGPALESLDAAQHFLAILSTPGVLSETGFRLEWEYFVTERNAGRKRGYVLAILFEGMSQYNLPPKLRSYESVRWDGKGKAQVMRFLRLPLQEIFRIDIRHRRIYWGIRPSQHSHLKELLEDQRVDGEKNGPIVTVWKSPHTEEGSRGCALARDLIPKSEWLALEAGVNLKEIIIKANNGDIIWRAID